MYNIPHHKAHSEEEVKQFIHDHPFAFVTGIDQSQKPVATQVPLLLEERDSKLFLVGHIMKNTDHHKAFLQNPNVVALFTGPHTYVSATWYTNPNMGSTWNFMSVHATGLLRMMDEQSLRALMSKLTLHFEKGNTASPTFFDNLPEEYQNRMIKAIDGFEIEVTKLEHVFKLSQDRDQESYENVIQKLIEQGADGKVIAEEMESRKAEVFR